jgi:small-conductance mechanosensitive channel
MIYGTVSQGGARNSAVRKIGLTYEEIGNLLSASQIFYLSLAIFAVVVGVTIHAVGLRGLFRRAKRSASVSKGSFSKCINGPYGILAPLVFIEMLLPIFPLSSSMKSILVYKGGILVVAGFAWLLLVMTYVLEDVVLSHYRIDVDYSLRARKVHSQIVVLRRVAIVVISVVALGTALLTFGQVRELVTGLLALARVIGILGGVAAKPTATNVMAGLQIAISQPIALDDVVVVNGHLGGA